MPVFRCRATSRYFCGVKPYRGFGSICRRFTVSPLTLGLSHAGERRFLRQAIITAKGCPLSAFAGGEYVPRRRSASGMTSGVSDGPESRGEGWQGIIGPVDAINPVGLGLVPNRRRPADECRRIGTSSGRVAEEAGALARATPDPSGGQAPALHRPTGISRRHPAFLRFTVCPLTLALSHAGERGLLRQAKGGCS